MPPASDLSRLADLILCSVVTIILDPALLFLHYPWATHPILYSRETEETSAGILWSPNYAYNSPEEWERLAWVPSDTDALNKVGIKKQTSLGFT